MVLEMIDLGQCHKYFEYSYVAEWSHRVFWGFFSPLFLFIYLFLTSLLEYNCFTVVC